jgi:hypothetical protein
MLVSTRSGAGIILLVVLFGCNRAPAPPPGTGAREAVRDYYEGLMRQDWQQAYGLVHPEIKKRMMLEKFTRLAQTYHRNLGFNPDQLNVQSCEENGTEAIAHIALMGQAASKQRRYKDAVVLRQSAEGWRVVPSATFGR